ncbi:hypothetical protein EXIGLDRAFT_750798 [Exidia glandulosa HHB12029]|uniref:Uncharacterized protein n=1 Tax=Exidia glandulosa HHB12029 TaxID=1314781 RepID=A0A165G9D2_EXIGL|nr:hypothetical protein EXIGLDRAFT_750798 [Exidia glandulosa HHB12029]
MHTGYYRSRMKPSDLLRLRQNFKTSQSTVDPGDFPVDGMLDPANPYGFGYMLFAWTLRKDVPGAIDCGQAKVKRTYRLMCMVYARPALALLGALLVALFWSAASTVVVILGVVHILPPPKGPARVAVHASHKRVTKTGTASARAGARPPPSPLRIRTAPAASKSYDLHSGTPVTVSTLHRSPPAPKSPPLPGLEEEEEPPSGTSLHFSTPLSSPIPTPTRSVSYDSSTATPPHIIVSPPSSPRLPSTPGARPRSWGSDRFSPAQPSPLRRIVSYEEPLTPASVYASEARDEARPLPPIRPRTMPAAKDRPARKDRHTISAEIARAAWGGDDEYA